MPRLAAALALVLVASSLALPRPAAAATDYPSGYRGFHTHAEMVAAVEAIAAAHPSIVRTFSIGESYQGRELLGGQGVRQRRDRRGRARGPTSTG